MSQDFLNAFFDSAQKFTQPFIEILQRENLLADIVEIDHVCYRVKTGPRYEFIKNELLGCSELLSEALVNGRAISTFKLRSPIEVSDTLKIYLVEVPSPKPGSPYAEGFEHIEAVVRVSLEKFMQKNAHLNFKVDNLHAKINRDVSVQFSAGLVKFHEESLQAVIANEKKR